MIAAPLTVTLTALIGMLHPLYPYEKKYFLCVSSPGVVVTSASSNILGTLYWNPIELLAAIQEHYHSSSHGKYFVRI